MRITRMLYPMLGLVALGACAKGADEAGRTETESRGAVATAPDPTAVRHAIDSANTKMVNAFTTGDATALSAQYDTDALIMMPNEPAWKGRSGIEEKGKGMFGDVALKDMKLNTQDVVVSGDIAVETGTYSLMVEAPKGAKAVPDNGKYIVVWRRQADGSWKAYRDIWNSDVAMKK